MKKLNSEFAEMLNSTTGRLLDQITVRIPFSMSLCSLLDYGSLFVTFNL